MKSMRWLSGALAALAGMLALPLVVVLVLTVSLSGVADQPVVQGALRGMGAVSAGLIAGTGLKLMVALRTNAMGRAVCAALAILTFIAIGLLRIPLVWVLLGLGAPAMARAYSCLLAQTKGARA